MTDINTAREEMTLMLLYLNSFEEKYGPLRSWKGYDFGTLDVLDEKGLIIQGDHPSRVKSVCMSDEGVAKAKELLLKYGIERSEEAHISLVLRAMPFLR